MKKKLLTLLSLTLMLTMVACGGDSDSKSDSADKNDRPSKLSERRNEKEKEKKEKDEDIDDEDIDDEDIDDEDIDDEDIDDEVVEDETEKSTLSGNFVIPEAPIIDNEYCSIKITDIQPDDDTGLTVKVQLENKSPDTTYNFSTGNTIINGVLSNSLLYSAVSPGKKANETIHFSNFYVKDDPTFDYSNIDVEINVKDADNWEVDPVVDEYISLYPYGEENTNTYVREAQETDLVLADNEYVKVTAIDTSIDDIWGYGIIVYLENKTDAVTGFSTENESINSLMISPYFSVTVPPYGSAFGNIDWDTDSLEENGIDDFANISSIEFDLIAKNWEDYDLAPYFNETISITPSIN